MAVRAVASGRHWQWRAGQEAAGRLQRLAYADAGKRDLRLDFLRGVAVSVMVIDHVGGDTILTALSGANQFIVSAAEAFVFLSGLIVGVVYGDRFRSLGIVQATRGLLRRAATLYKASVGMALVFLGLFWFTDIRLWFDRSNSPTTGDPIQVVTGILTLRFAFHGSDVLVMYTLMMLVAPAVLYLMHQGRTPLVVAGSVALWAVYQSHPEGAALPWVVGNSAFQVAAWQLLFVLGMAVGFHRKQVENWLLGGGNRAWPTILIATLMVVALVRANALYGSLPLPSEWWGDATFGSMFAKASLGPGRVLAFLAIAALAYNLVNALWVPLSRLLGWFLVPLGQNSLYVYITHLFVLVLMYNLAPIALIWIPIAAVNLAAQSITLCLVWTMVRTRFLFGLIPR